MNCYVVRIKILRLLSRYKALCDEIKILRLLSRYKALCDEIKLCRANEYIHADKLK